MIRRARCVIVVAALSVLVNLPTASALAGGGDTTGRVDPWRIALVAGVTGGVMTAVHLYERNAWWDGPKGEFWFVNDWIYSRGNDKWTHAYATYILAYGFESALRWGGVEKRPAVVYGSICALGFQLYVETQDGFHNTYGFSPGDVIADVCGAAYPILQDRYPVLENFHPKWSYFPSDTYLHDRKDTRAKIFFDDYEGQKTWLGIDPHPFLGQGFSDVIPRWLGIAIGVGVKDSRSVIEPGRRIVYVALDYNLRRIETESGFLRELFKALDFLHLPAPGLIIGDGSVRLGIVF